VVNSVNIRSGGLNSGTSRRLLKNCATIDLRNYGLIRLCKNESSDERTALLFLKYPFVKLTPDVVWASTDHNNS